MSGLVEHEFNTDEGTVHYWTSRCSSAPAQNASWLVLLPGLTADHTLFDAQIDHFAGKCNVFVWDAPAHGLSRPYPLDFSMDDYARILHAILQTEDIQRPVLVGQSLGGYVAQAYMDLFPDCVSGFISLDSAQLKKKYYPKWEVAALRHTKGMYLAIPWSLLLRWGPAGTAQTQHGRANMRAMMEQYDKRSYCELAGHGYTMLADAIDANRPYDISCPALLLCGEKDQAGDVRPFNRKWTVGENIPLVWVPGAGHNSNVDNPMFVNDQIERFVAELG